ncbi:MAG: RSP_7527 family protein [Variibacter sp.]
MEVDIEPRRRADGSIDHDYYRKRAAALRAETRQDIVISAGRWLAAMLGRLGKRLTTAWRSSVARACGVRRMHGS